MHLCSTVLVELYYIIQREREQTVLYLLDKCFYYYVLPADYNSQLSVDHVRLDPTTRCDVLINEMKNPANFIVYNKCICVI